MEVPKGLTLQINEDFPHIIKQVMEKCWQYQTKNRCTFEDVVKTLQNAIHSTVLMLDNPSYGKISATVNLQSSLQSEESNQHSDDYVSPISNKNCYIDVMK